MQELKENDLGSAALEDIADKESAVIGGKPDIKAIIAGMVESGEISQEDAAKFERMFSGGGAGMQRLGKHNIARAQRAKARIAKRKKKR